jgi:integrase
MVQGADGGQCCGIKIQKPHFSRFSTSPRKADILTTEEIKALFVPKNFSSQTIYAMFLLCLSGGLRIGEARAVRRKQIFFERKALLVDGFCKSDGRRTVYNKKGSPEHPRFRVTLLPDFTLGELRAHIEAHGIEADDLLFTIGGAPIPNTSVRRYFLNAVKLAGIKTRGRKIVPHSLRYTYVTRMRRELPGEIVMKMVGHTSLEQTDYYTSRAALDETLAGLIGADTAADNLFT